VPCGGSDVPGTAINQFDRGRAFSNYFEFPGMNPGLARGFAAWIKGLADKRADRFASLHDLPSKTSCRVLLETNLNLLAAVCLDRLTMALFVKS
jgi:hypothetical protein